MSVFRSAIQGDDGLVDAGYLALFWTMAVTVGVIPLVVTVGGVAAYLSPKDAAAVIQSTGIAVGAICTGGAAVIGAVGVFRLGDKPRASPAATVTTTTTATGPAAAGVVTPAEPIKVDVLNLPDPKPERPKGKRRAR